MNLVVSQTLQKSPIFKSYTLNVKKKNPYVYKNMKFLGLLSGKTFVSESQPKESIPLTYSLKIPDEKKEENKDEENKKE